MHVSYKVMITDYGLVGAASFDAQLASIYELLKEFCKRNQIPLHMDGLTRNLLNFKRDSDYPVGILGRNTFLKIIPSLGFISGY